MDNVFAVSAFSDNYIWILHDAVRQQAVVVDPGDATPVLEALSQMGLELVAILTTHHHGDHVGGVPELLAHRSVPVYGPADERIPGRTIGLAEGDRVSLPDLALTFDVLDVPGHTAGHIAYVGHGMLFCGDTLFAGGCGRLFEGSPAQMYESLNKIAVLEGATRVYCAHEYTQANLIFASRVEPDNERLQARLERVRTQRERGEMTLPSDIDTERATNPFLRTDAETVIQRTEKHAGQRLSSSQEVFAAVRAWKDNF